VGIFYLAALIIGFGTIALQLFLSGDHDADAEGGAHVGDAAADGELDGSGEADPAAGHGAHGEGGFLPIFLSLRFWTFALLAFGLSGTLLHYLDLANAVVTLAVAAGLGVASGLLASLTFRALARAELSSAATSRDAVGQIGRVLVPLGKSRRGKIRIELKGQTVDLLATTDDEELEAGQMVVVEELRDTTAHVTQAPPELLVPHKGD
jgi:membrane protein implicated in regulation of membrane protease activity